MTANPLHKLLEAILGHRRPAAALPVLMLAGILGASALWWILAFLPVSPDSAGWVARAQAVCFGTTESGLPADYGWISLLGGPPTLLGALLVLWGRELAAGLRALAAAWWGRAVLLALVLVPVVTGAWSGQRIAAALQYEADVAARIAETTERVVPLPPERRGEPAPAFTLTDQRGRRVSLQSLRGHPVWLTVAFGHCETVCPVVVHRVMTAARQPGGAEARAVVVTLDPWRDTVSSLPRIAAKWEMGPGTHLLSGPVAAVNAVLDRYRVGRTRDRRTGDIVHPPLVYVIDPDGRLFARLDNPSVDALIRAARQAAGRSEHGVAAR